jgi:hypothetical protein
MFFRREKPQQWTLESRLANLKQFGFETGRDASGKAIVKRNGCAATVDDNGSGNVTIGKAGVLMGPEIAHLIHGGYQMMLHTASGKEVPALAEHLTALHKFTEDLREGLGLTSLYNVALGTTCDDHLYDRVKDRDAKPPVRPWEKKIAHS